jgi:hypothetical protein
MYSSIHATGESALVDLALAEELILQLHGRMDKGTHDGGLGGESTKQPLWRLTYKYMAPKCQYSHPVDGNGVMYVSPPTEGMDYDDAYREAKSMFLEIFSQEEEFLVQEEMDDGTEGEDT